MSGQAVSGKRRGQPISPLARHTDFSFLPKGLLEKCTPFIVRYHEMNGYACLPDILWHPEIRNFIEIDATFQRLFKKSTSSRSAKRANEGLVGIATIILAIEILATGFAGWGIRYPAARKRAQAILEEFVPSSRAWLIERYLYPQTKRSQESLGAVDPADWTDREVNGRFEPGRNSSPGRENVLGDANPGSD
jgi:hypothetical protein